MDRKDITPRYSVAGELAPQDLAGLRADGFTDVICNRPDAEVSPEIGSDAMRAAAEAEGLRFHVNPVPGGMLPPEAATAQAEALSGAEGRVLAYCRSGTRSTMIWALGQAGTDEADTLIAAAGRAGYDISMLRPYLAGNPRRG